MSSNTLYSATPSVTVLDNRGQSVRDILYHRHPDAPESIDERITRHRYDEHGSLAQSADPRLHDAGLANFSYLTDLAGNVLRTQSADAGITVALNDAAGRPFMTVTDIAAGENGQHDASQAVTRICRYEDASLPGRPLSTTEQGADGVPRITERFVYAGNTQREKELNLAGQCVSHYDTTGLVQTDGIALSGVPLSVTRRLLKDADNPDALADWQGGDASAWNDLLAAEAFTTLSTADATAAVLMTTDAKGNLQRVAYDVAGQLSGSWLTLKGGKEQVIVKSQSWSAAGQKLREEHGNGVVTTYTYEPETQRLTGVRTERPDGHAAGAKVLQDLRYEYDPVGNVLMVRNNAEETRFWRNQKVVPESAYAYDSLYQLVSASGREMASGGEQGANLPLLSSFDGATYTNYTRTYTYDRGGNLTQIRHGAPATGNNYTTSITIGNRSNRGVLSTLTEKPSEVDALFTAGGQQKQLLPGQALSWTARGELRQVTPVVRDGAAGDGESYRYDGSSQRVLKVSVQKTANSTQDQRVLYLAGVELRTRAGGGTETESLQVITVGEAGRAQVRALHWESGKPAAVSNNQLRYSYDNLVGSSTLEVDGGGNLISMEEYYPYGGTAAWTARSQAEADYKTVRYSGKERDATGLYYYGYRYYQPWAGRWLSVDPAGTVDGLNLFRMVRNNPVTLKDLEGKLPVLPFTFESEVQRAVKGAIHYMKIALNILEANDSAAIAEISDSLYGNHSETTLNSWKEGLKSTISIASEFHVKRNLNINKEKDGTSVAHVESQELSSYRKYYQPVARIKNSDMSKSEMKRSISEVNINYQSERNEKYLNISKGLFRENVERFGKAHAPTMLIHEFSHAASNTEDYIYAMGYRERPNDISYSTLNSLQEGTLSDNLKRDHMDYNTDPRKSAMNNADTFAHASSLLYFSSRSAGVKNKAYKDFLIQKERNFARPSVSH